MAVALLACASLACAGFAVAHAAIASTYQVAKSFVLEGFALMADKSPAIAPPVVMLTQAKAFVARLAKRERPVLTASWRMCPSI